MTLQELYQGIGGDYDQAMRVLCVEKLLDKHIRKFGKNNVVSDLLRAGETMDPQEMFETAHAVKGVSGNLALTELYRLASELSDEFRPGNARRLSDGEVRDMLGRVAALYQRTAEEISRYEEEA